MNGSIEVMFLFEGKNYAVDRMNCVPRISETVEYVDGTVGKVVDVVWKRYVELNEYKMGCTVMTKKMKKG